MGFTVADIARCYLVDGIGFDMKAAINEPLVQTRFGGLALLDI